MIIYCNAQRLQSIYSYTYIQQEKYNVATLIMHDQARPNNKSIIVSCPHKLHSYSHELHLNHIELSLSHIQTKTKLYEKVCLGRSYMVMELLFVIIRRWGDLIDFATFTGGDCW